MSIDRNQYKRNYLTEWLNLILHYTFVLFKTQLKLEIDTK